MIVQFTLVDPFFELANQLNVPLEHHLDTVLSVSMRMVTHLGQNLLCYTISTLDLQQDSKFQRFHVVSDQIIALDLKLTGVLYSLPF